MSYHFRNAQALGSWAHRVHFPSPLGKPCVAFSPPPSPCSSPLPFQRPLTQLPQIPQLPVSSSSNFQDEINHRIEDARAQVEDITSKAFPQKAPKQKAPTSAQEKKTEPRNSGGVDCANCVAITYDDGPGAETNRLLDKLKAKNAHASFMVLALVLSSTLSSSNA